MKNKLINIMKFFGDKPNRMSFKDCMFLTKTGNKIKLYKTYIFNEKKQIKCFKHNGDSTNYKRGRRVIYGYVIAKYSSLAEVSEAYLLSRMKSYNYTFIGYKAKTPFICRNLIFDKEPKIYKKDFIVIRFRSYDSNF